MLVGKHVPDSDVHLTGERAQKSSVPLDFVFTSSKGRDADVPANPWSPDFDKKAVPLGTADLPVDVCDAVEQEGAYAPPPGDGTGELDSSSSEEGSDSEDEDEDDEDDDEDSDGDDDDDDMYDDDVLQLY
jgi:hypothetical protein